VQHRLTAITVHLSLLYFNQCRSKPIEISLHCQNWQEAVTLGISEEPELCGYIDGMYAIAKDIALIATHRINQVYCKLFLLTDTTQITPPQIS